MVSEAIRDAFYRGIRSEELPLAVNDVVTVTVGSNGGQIASVISPEEGPPEAKYLVEFTDGSGEIIPLVHLRRNDERP
jgi:hypothetical protein